MKVEIFLWTRLELDRWRQTFTFAVIKSIRTESENDMNKGWRAEEKAKFEKASFENDTAFPFPAWTQKNQPERLSSVFLQDYARQRFRDGK